MARTMFYEKLFDGFLIQMRRGTFLPTVKFMIALPDHPAVFVVGMPDLGAKPSAAVSAFNLIGKDTDTAGVGGDGAECHR